MMRRVVVVCIVLTLALISSSFRPTIASAQQLNTVWDVISSRQELTITGAAMKATGFDSFLSNRAPYTVFAPTDDAWKVYFKANSITQEQALADKAGLLSFLTYHVAPGWLGTGTFGLTLATESPFKLATLHSADALTISDNGGTRMVNDATIVTPDLDASSGGTVHIIDKVLIPLTPLATAKTNSETKNLVDVIKANGATSFAAALTSLFPTIGTDLSVSTLFVPTNDAFSADLKSLNLTSDQFMADAKTVSRTIRYHLISWYYPSDVLAKMDGVYIGTSVTDAMIRITVKGSAIMVNDANVTTADVPATNQVMIHVIDKVLTPMNFTGPSAASLATQQATQAQ